MKTELFRYWKNPLYWGVIAAGLSVRAVFACLDGLYRYQQYWALAADFWSKIGSVAEGFLILLVLIHLFSIDRERRTLPLISSTAYGRGRLFFRRLAAGGVAAAAGVFLLALGNGGISLWFGRGEVGLSGHWILIPAVIAGMGALGFFLLSACVCDLAQNQPAAMCVCGLPFAVGYFINEWYVKPFELLWFFRHGFFTELMRGRLITDLPIFWMLWYPLLLAGILCLTIKRRRERKEL